MTTAVDDDYLAKRQLKKGTAGWVLLAGLGVSYVISGDFAGWNFGIGEAGCGYSFGRHAMCPTDG